MKYREDTSQEPNHGFIYISYHNRDEKWKNMLETHLRVFEIRGDLSVLNNRIPMVGRTWADVMKDIEIRADLIVMMISPDYLASNRIQTSVVPLILEGGLRIYPLIVRPCAWRSIQWLSSVQVVPRDGQSLTEKNRGSIDRELTEISMEINGILSNARSSSPDNHAKNSRMTEKEATGVDQGDTQYEPEMNITTSEHPPIQTINPPASFKMGLASALLECQAMNDSDTRDVIVSDLPRDIRDGIKRSSIGRVDVFNIVDRCMVLENGVNKLLEILRFFEGGATCMERIDELIEEHGLEALMNGK